MGSLFAKDEASAIGVDQLAAREPLKPPLRRYRPAGCLEAARKKRDQPIETENVSDKNIGAAMR